MSEEQTPNENQLPKINTSPRMNRTETLPEKDWKWWYYVLGGIGAIAFAAYLYVDLTEFETHGGTRMMSKPFKFAYDIAGKWGVVGLMSGMGLLGVYMGIQEYWSQKKAAE